MTQNQLSDFEQTLVEGLRSLYKQLALQNQLLERIVIASERTADYIQQLVPTNPEAPNLSAPLESFNCFDWSTIPATVERSDQYGAAIVSWRGQQYVRRSPINKFGEAIWFSRCVGKDENGENQYERLITFKPVLRVEVDPIPEKVSRHYQNGKPNTTDYRYERTS